MSGKTVGKTMIAMAVVIFAAQLGTFSAAAAQHNRKRHKTAVITGHVYKSVGEHLRDHLEDVSGVLVRVATLRGKVVAQTRSGSSGRFYTVVKPGMYRVSSCGASLAVKIRAGEHATANLRADRCSCDQQKCGPRRNVAGTATLYGFAGTRSFSQLWD